MLKKSLKISGIVLGVLLLLAVGLIAYGLHDPKTDISPAAYSWRKGMSETEIEMAADSLVKAMSFDEKVGQLAGNGSLALLRIGIRFGLFKDSEPYSVTYSGENTRLDIPPIAFSDGPRGVTVGTSTNFPVAMARGASWDTDLERRVGSAIGEECRALNVNYFGGLCVNLLRHPAWGRAQETFGEDPYHIGEMGLAVMEGVQSHHVMACAKHFAANSIENSRFYVDVKMDERTLREVYLPHFKKLSDNGVASVMSSYNKLNGEFCGQNGYLLSSILRDDWGFKGFVTSDWIWGVKDAGKGIAAGLDVEMPAKEFYTTKNIQNAIDNGALKLSRVDELVKNVVQTKLRFISRKDSQDYPESLVANKEHTDLALESAEKSMVLLKNKDHFLPLSETKVKTVAVIGELATENNTGDKGSSYVKPSYVVNILEGLKKYEKAGVKIEFSDGTDLNEAITLSKSADAVIIVAGYQFNEEGEYVVNDPQERGQYSDAGGDRKSLRLKDKDVELIKEVSRANSNTVVSLIGGSAIIMEEWRAAPKAIIMAWYPGMEGGNALANILFGKVNPSGKLPFTIPKHERELPTFDAFAETADYGYYHGYTLFDKKNIDPAFPFGFGLSYTTFSYDDLQVRTPTFQKDGSLKVSVTIRNSGKVAGEEAVQLYVGFKNSKIDRPVKLLRAFEKISIAPNAEKIVEFKMKAADLAYYNTKTKAWEVETMTYEVYVGSSSDERNLLKASFDVKNRLSISMND